MNPARTTLASLVTTVATCLGCAGAATTTTRTSTPEAIAETAATSTRRTPTKVSLREDVARNCPIPAPQFAFDSAAAQSDPPLAALVKCFKSGPLAGRKMLLIGKTEPRGDADGASVPGQQRAHAVSETLQSKGLPPDQISTTSVGEFYADGYDETTWADGRRVEVGVQR